MAAYGTTVTVQCNDGYKLSNVSTSTVLMCMEGGHWNASFDDCERKYTHLVRLLCKRAQCMLMYRNV